MSESSGFVSYTATWTTFVDVVVRFGSASATTSIQDADTFIMNNVFVLTGRFLEACERSRPAKNLVDFDARDGEGCGSVRQVRTKSTPVGDTFITKDF